MQQHVDLALLPVEAVLLVADRLDRLARGRLDLALHRLLVERGADFAGDHDAVGRGQGLAGDAHLGGIHAGLGGFLEEEVDDLVRNPVANLVGVAFSDGLAGKEVVLAGHGSEILATRAWATRNNPVVGLRRSAPSLQRTGSSSSAEIPARGKSVRPAEREEPEIRPKACLLPQAIRRDRSACGERGCF